MTKLPLHTPDLSNKNYAALAALFPNAVTETIDENDNVVRAIDADILAQEINTHVVSGKEERYQFTWPEKKKSILLANSPIAATLRPCREESVNFDDTENLYIEGDNLDVLKLLHETYLNRIKMIYIDPPYNKGSDIVYKDDYTEENDNFLIKDRQYDDSGNRMVQNLDSNGRFHTDWLNMIYPRLRIARDLLTTDGIIFISIGDRELHNTRKIFDEIYGEENFEGHIHWRRRHNQPNDKTKMIGLVAEHIICYAKDSNELKKAGVGKIDLTGDFSNPDNDPRGDWASKPWKVGSDQSGSRYLITTPNGVVFDEEWMGEETTYQELLTDNRIIFPRGGDGTPRKKYFKNEREREGQCATNWWDHAIFGHNQGANDCLTELFKVKNVFSNPKPVELLYGLMQISNVKNNDIILDFFSGSATTAHTAMLLNKEKSLNIHFILVQYAEDLEKQYEEASGKTKVQLKVSIDFLKTINKPLFITEIGKERIRRAGEKIVSSCQMSDVCNQTEHYELITNHCPLTTNNSPDIGFRVLKLDSSNMKDVYYAPQDIVSDSGGLQIDLDGFVDNIKPDRTAEDLLFQVMLDLGIPLSAKIERKEHDGKTIYYVNPSDHSQLSTSHLPLTTTQPTAHLPLPTTHYLAACFDRVTNEIVTEIAKTKPYYALFRDSSFYSDATLVNFDQIFKTYSPETKRKVL